MFPPVERFLKSHHINQDRFMINDLSHMLLTDHCFSKDAEEEHDIDNVPGDYDDPEELDEDKNLTYDLEP